jgi:hypothetical protein
MNTLPDKPIPLPEVDKDCGTERPRWVEHNSGTRSHRAEVSVPSFRGRAACGVRSDAHRKGGTGRRLA